MVKEINEGSVYEMHVVNRLLRESENESFVVEDCNREILVNEFGKQNLVVAMCDVVKMDNVLAISGMVEESVPIIVGL